MMKWTLLILILFPLLQGCDVTSIFDSGPSDEELFKQAGNKKVFPPSLTNVKDGEILKIDHAWQGSCGTDATVEIKSTKIKGGSVKISCKDRKFSQPLEWENFNKDEKIEVSILQEKAGTKSDEQKIFVTLISGTEIKKEEKKEPVILPVAEQAKPIEASVAKVEEKISPVAPVVAPPVEKVEPISAPIAEPATVPEVVVMPVPQATQEQLTQVTQIKSETIDEKFISNTSQEVLIDLTGAIVINEVGAGGGKNFAGAKNLVDEQRIAGDPKLNKGNSGFKTVWSEAARLNKELSYQKSFLSGIYDLGKLYQLTEVYIFGGNNVVSFYSGGPVKDWLLLGQVRLRPGVWNKVQFDKKMNTHYIKVGIDFLSSDNDGDFTASSGSEMILYGKPFDNRSPAGLPNSKEILKEKSFDEIVGVNLFVSDPVGSEWIYTPEAKGKFKQKNAVEPIGIEAFSHVRLKLYTPWFLTHFDHEASNWLLRFQSIALEHHRLDLDYYFQEINKQRSLVNNKNISVYPSFEYTIPSLFPQKIKEHLSKDKNHKKDSEGQVSYSWNMGKVKPLSSTDKNMGQIPKDFKDEAELYFQYAGRYGKTPSDLLDKHRKIASDQKAASGLGFISAIEAYTNPDKAKNSFCPECSFFHPQEYAAYLSAIYDGDQKSLGSNYGVKASAPSTPVVFGSLSIPTIDYPLMVSLWSKEYRSSQNLPFDVLGYTAMSRYNGKASMPEASGLFETFKNLVVEKNRFFPDKELWITEFGFESDPTSFMGVNVPPGFTPEEVQGIWLTRGLLLLTAAGVDRVYLQPLFDNNHFSKTSYGLIYSAKDQFKTKKSYFLVTSLIKALNEYVFDKTTDTFEDHKGNQDVITLRFKHKLNPKKMMYVSWTPTNNGANHILSRYELPLDLVGSDQNLKAQVVNLNLDDIEPKRSPANSEQSTGKIIIEAREVPTLIEVEIP